MNTIEQTIDGKRYVFEMKLLLVEDVSDPTESDSDSEDDEEVIREIEDELKNNVYHKMESLLNRIEANDLEQLKQYVFAGHPAIKLNRRSTISSITDALLAELYNHATQKQIKESGARIRAILNAQTQNINHLAKRFGNLRKILADRFGEDSPIYKWHRRHGLEYEQFVEKQTAQNLNRDNRLANITRIDEKDAHEILNRTSSSDDVFDNIIALQIATGARFIEAVRVSSFHRVPYSDNVVKIVGVAKKGKAGKEYELDRPIFGMNIDELLELQKDVRKELKRSYKNLDKMTNDEVNKLLLGNVNRRVKALGIQGVKSSHDMRKIFGAITHAELPEENRKAIDRHLHIKNVLGHAKLETAGNYANVRIKKKRNKIKTNEALEQKLDVIDKVNDRQDRDINELQEKVDVPTAAAPVVSRRAKVNTQVFVVRNLRGENVQIVMDITPTRGNAKIRLLNVLEQMRDHLVLITESLLKQFGFGSKPIAAVSDQKSRFNAEIMADVL